MLDLDKLLDRLLAAGEASIACWDSGRAAEALSTDPAWMPTRVKA